MKPALPMAGSQMTSSGVGAMSSTIILMMWRGVRNWPFCPLVASLDSRYSYTSPMMSLLERSISSSFSTMRVRVRGLLTRKVASFM